MRKWRNVKGYYATTQQTESRVPPLGSQHTHTDTHTDILPLLIRCFSPDRIPGVSMMLMLWRTWLGIWEQINLNSENWVRIHVFKAATLLSQANELSAGQIVQESNISTAPSTQPRTLPLRLSYYSKSLRRTLVRWTLQKVVYASV